MKDYINNVYQAFSKIQPRSMEAVDAGVVMRHGYLQENWLEKDTRTGNLYLEKPNWLGGETKTLSQGMADYIFEDVNVPIGQPPKESVDDEHWRGMFVRQLPISSKKKSMK